MKFMAKKPKKPTHPVTQYAQDIVKGKILANKWALLACKRHLDDLKKSKKKDYPYYFDEAAADHIIDFYREFLILYEGAVDGQPFVLTPNLSFIVGSIFGWKKKEDGFRRFRTAYIEMAKGQIKTPLASGIGLYGLTFDDEAGAEVYAAAVTREQAGICFRDAHTFAEGSEDLRDMLIIDKHNIANPETNSFFRPISSEKRGLDGKRPHIALIDEIHEHPNDMVVRKMSAGTKFRRNSLIIEITNAGYDRHSICYQHHEYTEKVLEGIVPDDTWFGLMSGLDVCEKCADKGKTIPQDGCPDCDDWRDEKNWIKANPNLPYLGASFLDYLRRQVEEAKAMPLQESLVKRLNFCIWTEGEIKWITATRWNSCREPILNIEDCIGLPCYAAFDLATKWDLAALVFLFIQENDDIFDIFGKFYLPEETARESKGEQYRRWVKDGYITQTPGARTDFKFIEDDIKSFDEKYHIIQLAYDPKEATYLVNNLQDWMQEDTCVEINQSPALMSEPMKELEARIRDHTIRHNGDPVLAWNISNVVLKESRGGPVKYYYPTKTSLENKIDGAVGLIMAVGRAMLRAGPIKSVYDGLTPEEIKERMAL